LALTFRGEILPSREVTYPAYEENHLPRYLGICDRSLEGIAFTHPDSFPSFSQSFEKIPKRKVLAFVGMKRKNPSGIVTEYPAYSINCLTVFDPPHYHVKKSRMVFGDV